MGTFQIPVRLSWTGASGSPGANIWHGRNTGDFPDSTEVQGLVDIIQAFYDTIKGIYTGSVDIDFDGEVTGVGADAGDTETADTWHIDGGPTTDFLAPANCFLVNWKTSSGGRRGRGRTFLGPLNSGQNQGDGTPVEAGRTLVQGAVDTLVSASGDFANGALGVWSREDLQLRDFTSGAVPNFMAVLRSRRD
jgi:hypothetical protein